MQSNWVAVQLVTQFSNTRPMLINNHNIQIETYGPEDGHPVVFLHHGLGSTRAWREQIPILADAGYYVLAYDRWGYGGSDPRPNLEVPSFRDDLVDLESILKIFELQSPTLIGHSDGGTIALYYAARYPKKVKSLVTIAAHIYLEAKMEPDILITRDAFETNERFRRGMRRDHGEKFESVFYNWFNGWHTPKAQDWDMRPLLSQITCPTLVIQGEEDQHATQQHARDIATSVVDGDLWLVPAAEHMLPQDSPNIFNSRLLAFLDFNCQNKN